MSQVIICGTIINIYNYQKLILIKFWIIFIFFSEKLVLLLKSKKFRLDFWIRRKNFFMRWKMLLKEEDKDEKKKRDELMEISIFFDVSFVHSLRGNQIPISLKYKETIRGEVHIQRYIFFFCTKIEENEFKKEHIIWNKFFTRIHFLTRIKKRNLMIYLKIYF